MEWKPPVDPDKRETAHPDTRDDDDGAAPGLLGQLVQMLLDPAKPTIPALQHVQQTMIRERSGYISISIYSFVVKETRHHLVFGYNERRSYRPYRFIDHIDVNIYLGDRCFDTVDTGRNGLSQVWLEYLWLRLWQCHQEETSKHE